MILIWDTKPHSSERMFQHLDNKNNLIREIITINNMHLLINQK